MVAHSDDSSHTAGEATANYMPDPVAAARIAKDLPDAKIIILLRDPAARVSSPKKRVNIHIVKYLEI